MAKKPLTSKDKYFILCFSITRKASFHNYLTLLLLMQSALNKRRQTYRQPVPCSPQSLYQLFPTPAQQGKNYAIAPAEDDAFSTVCIFLQNLQCVWKKTLWKLEYALKVKVALMTLTGKMGSIY